MAETIKTTYDGVEVSYSERDDSWHFELRGRSRTSETLTKAKEAIDAPPPKDKKPFKRTKAYLYSYAGIQEVEITSLAESIKYSSRQKVWISRNGERRKEDMGNLYEFSEDNAKLYAEYTELKKQSAELDVKAKEAAGKMKKVDLSGHE